MQFICGGTFDVGASPDNFKRAEICRQRMGPVFKRIAMNYPPFLFHPINSITAYKGQIIYDSPGHRGQGADPGAIPAVAERARRDAPPPMSADDRPQCTDSAAGTGDGAGCPHRQPTRTTAGTGTRPGRHRPRAGGG